MSYQLESINPTQLGAPRGYANGILAPVGGRLLFVAGQIAWNSEQVIVSEDFSQQFRQALANVLAVVEEVGGGPTAIAQLTLYVTDKNEYLAALKQVGAAYRDLMGSHFPTMAMVEVSGLLEPAAKVEIQAQAVLAPAASDSKLGTEELRTDAP